jgi:hypothetical protein
MTHCNCEHAAHFDTDEWGPRSRHRYMRVAAGDQRAEWVGEVCDYCAIACLSDYLIREES